MIRQEWDAMGRLELEEEEHGTLRKGAMTHMSEFKFGEVYKGLRSLLEFLLCPHTYLPTPLIFAEYL